MQIIIIIKEQVFNAFSIPLLRHPPEIYIYTSVIWKERGTN